MSLRTPSSITAPLVEHGCCTSRLHRLEAGECDLITIFLAVGGLSSGSYIKHLLQKLGVIGPLKKKEFLSTLEHRPIGRVAGDA